MPFCNLSLFVNFSVVHSHGPGHLFPYRFTVDFPFYFLQWIVHCNIMTSYLNGSRAPVSILAHFADFNSGRVFVGKEWVNVSLNVIFCTDVQRIYCMLIKSVLESQYQLRFLWTTGSKDHLSRYRDISQKHTRDYLLCSIGSASWNSIIILIGYNWKIFHPAKMVPEISGMLFLTLREGLNRKFSAI